MIRGLSTCIAATKRLRSLLAPHRRPLAAALGAFFIIGLLWSFASLGLRPWQLAPAPILFLLLLFGPLGVAYGAVGLGLVARAGAVRIGFAQAFRVDAYAQVAEMLPLPGGAIVRTGALIKAGAVPYRSAALVIGSALLWISLATLATGLVLAARSSPAGHWLAAIGAAGSLIAIVGFASVTSLAVTLSTLAHRLAGLAIAAARLHFAFAAVHVLVPIENSLPFALASIAGSAASIAPAGLGVSESLAALMADWVGVAAPAAFLAVALNRILALLSAGLILVVIELRTTEKFKEVGADEQPGIA